MRDRVGVWTKRMALKKERAGPTLLLLMEFSGNNKIYPAYNSPSLIDSFISFWLLMGVVLVGAAFAVVVVAAIVVGRYVSYFSANTYHVYCR